MARTYEPDAGLERVSDVEMYDFSDKTAVHFKLRVPNPHHEDLKSSAVIKDGVVTRLELRLGQVPKTLYDVVDARKVLHRCLREVDIPAIARAFPDDMPVEAKINQDPAWVLEDHLQIHLVNKYTYGLKCSVDELLRFADGYTTAVVDAFEWEVER